MTTVDSQNKKATYLDPQTGFLRIDKNVHWSKVLARNATIPVSSDAYAFLHEQFRHIVAENLKIPTEQDLLTRLGPDWRAKGARIGIKRYWPKVKHWDERARLGIAQTLNPVGAVGTCAQIADVQVLEVYRREHGLWSPNAKHLSETDLLKLCEEHKIGFTESKAVKWIEEGIIIVVENQAVRLLDHHRDTVSISAINGRIEYRAGKLDAEQRNFQREELQQIGELSGRPLIRNLSHQKKDPVFSRLLITDEQAQKIIERCDQPDLPNLLSRREAILTESDVRQALREQPDAEDRLPEGIGDLFQAKFWLGYLYPEERQHLSEVISVMLGDKVTLDWRANLAINGRLRGFSKYARSRKCVFSEQSISIESLREILVEQGCMASITVYGPLKGELPQIAGHTIALRQMCQEDGQAIRFLYNDSGPKGSLERVGGFLTKEGIIPIAGFDGAKNRTLTSDQLDHWLYSYHEILWGETPVRCYANMLVPTTHR